MFYKLQKRFEYQHVNLEVICFILIIACFLSDYGESK